MIATSQADTTKSATAMVNIAAVGISLNSIGVTLDVGNQFLFVATVTGTGNTGVSWAIQEGASGGNITNSGLYTAPGADGTFHVIATSQADTTQKGIATVTVAPLTVSVIPPSNVLGLLGVRHFIASVNTSLNTKVTWSVQEGAAGGAIAASGRYTAPNTTGGPFHVVATSVQDSTKNGIGNVTVVGSGFRPTGDMNAFRTAHTATLLPQVHSPRSRARDRIPLLRATVRSTKLFWDAGAPLQHHALRAAGFMQNRARRPTFRPFRESILKMSKARTLFIDFWMGMRTGTCRGVTASSCSITSGGGEIVRPRSVLASQLPTEEEPPLMDKSGQVLKDERREVVAA